MIGCNGGYICTVVDYFHMADNFMRFLFSALVQVIIYTKCSKISRVHREHSVYCTCTSILYILCWLCCNEGSNF